MKKTSIITLVAIILLISMIIVASFFVKRTNQTIFESYTFYQYFGGEKYEYEGSIELTRNNDITQIKFNDIKIDLDSTPIYYSAEEKVLFPENMAIVYPTDNGAMYKINRFSTIKREDNSVFFEKENQTKKLVNAFLFDGNDLYFFLEPTVINVEGQEYEVSSLSYAKVTYNGNVEIYNKEKDEYTILEGNFKTVTAKTENYTMNLSVDSIQNGESEQLLIRKITNLNNLEME